MMRMKNIRLFEDFFVAEGNSREPEFGWTLEMYLDAVATGDVGEEDILTIMNVHSLYNRKEFKNAYKAYQDADTACRDMMDGTGNGQGDWADWIASKYSDWVKSNFGDPQ